jgi:hypothetical protein
MLFDPLFIDIMLAAVLLGLPGIAKLCLVYSWSNRPSRIFSKNNET